MGKSRQLARTELEKLDFENLDCRSAINEVVRILQLAQNEAKDKEVELEVSWVCSETGGRHMYVPADVLAAAIEHARLANRPDDEMED